MDKVSASLSKQIQGLNVSKDSEVSRKKSAKSKWTVRSKYKQAKKPSVKLDRISGEEIEDLAGCKEHNRWLTTNARFETESELTI